MAGFTAERDMGTEGAGAADTAVRDAIDQGLIPGPRLRISGNAIDILGGHEDAIGYNPEQHVLPNATWANNANELVTAIREQFKLGADFIKIYETGRDSVSDGKLTTPYQYTEAEMTAAVAEAARVGKHVAVHATGEPGTLYAARAGVVSIDHAFQLSDETMRVMHEKQIFAVPTLTIIDYFTEHAATPRSRCARTQPCRNFTRSISQSSSPPVFPSPWAPTLVRSRTARKPASLSLMVKNGMTPLASLQAGTHQRRKTARLARPDWGQGMREIVQTLVIAIVLVILVVYLFLQDWRATLIPLLAVPVSLVGTFVFFPLFGFSINTLSMFGLVLAIGLVVDDAIVVVEGVQRHIEEGLAPKDAARKAMEELSGPVIGIALVLSSVFVPTAFIPGITGRLYQQFAVTIAISVVLSAFNALTLSPALAGLLLRPKKESRGLLRRFFDWFNRIFERTTHGYVRLSGALIRRSVLALVALLVFGVAGLFFGSRVPSSFLPDEDQGYVYVNMQLPNAASLERTAAASRQVEKILADTPGVEYTTSVAGFSLLSFVRTTYNAFYFVTLKPWGDRKTKAEQYQEIKARLNQQLSKSAGGNRLQFLAAGDPWSRALPADLRSCWKTAPGGMSSSWPTIWTSSWRPLASVPKLARSARRFCRACRRSSWMSTGRKC